MSELVESSEAMQYEVMLTAGAIRNGYISVDPRWRGFTAAMCGGKEKDAEGLRAKFCLPGGSEEHSDLRPNGPGSARIRSRFTALFQRLGLQPGDTLVIRRTAAAEYQIKVRAGQGMDHFEHGYQRLRTRLLLAMPGFTGFDSDPRMHQEIGYKHELIEQFTVLLQPALAAADAMAVWNAVLRLLKVRVGGQTPVTQNVVSWRITAQLAELSVDDQQAMGEGLIALFASQPVDAGVDAFNACMSGLQSPVKPAASQRSLASLLLTLHDPQRYCFVKTGQFGRALMMLDPSFAWERSGISAQGWVAVRALLQRLGDRLASDGWPAKDMIALQSFLWVAVSYGQPEDEAGDEVHEEQEQTMNAFDPGAGLLPSNTLLYGPPGTGKTHAMVDRAIALLDPVLHAHTISADREARLQRKHRYDALVAEGRIGFVTFHQSVAYEDFVEGLKARTTANGALEYAVVPGIFVDLCRRARSAAQVSDTPAPAYLLIIDEINRGNIARIFGELITLIEPSKREGMDEALQVTLPYSRETFAVPANLHILGTMNTADRSLAAMDLALRRRFDFVEMPPRPELLDKQVAGLHLGTLLSILNARIEVLLGRDHLIGHAYLIGVQDLAGLADAFASRIIPLLQEYFFEDWQRIGWVLNDHQKPEAYRFLRQHAVDVQQLFGAEVAVPGDGDRWYIQHAAFARIEAYQGIIAPSVG